MNNGDYPIGAKDDPNAPYNEPLYVKHKRIVTLTITYEVEIEGDPDMDEGYIRNYIIRDIQHGILPYEFEINDITINKD